MSDSGKSQVMLQGIVALTAFSFALLTIFSMGAERVTFGDAPDYLEAADAIAKGKAFPRECSFPFFRPPLYPFFIACVWQVTPGSIVAVKLAQAGVFAMTCWILYRLGLLATQDRLAALLGGLIYSVNPFALRQVAEIQSEPLHTLLMALAILWLVSGLVNAGGRRGSFFFLAGITLGVASLCRPSAWPITMGLTLLLLPLLWKQTGRRAIVLAGMVPLGLALSIAPWTWLNWRATGEFILVSDTGGFNLWIGNHPDTLRLFQQPFRSKEEFDKYGTDHLQHELPGAKMAEWETTTGYRELSLRQREQLWQKEALRNMREHPGTTAALFGEKFLAYWRPWLNPSAYTQKEVWISGIAVTGLYLLAGAGAWLLRPSSNGRKVLWVFVGLFGFSTLLHVLVYSMIRYRLPYVDPYLCVLAGIAVQKGLSALAARWHPASLRSDPVGGIGCQV